MIQKLLLTFIGLTLSFTTLIAEDKIYTGFFNNNAISGYDTVAYFTQQKPVKGKKEFSTDYEGATWLFANQEHLDLFLANPTKYAPQYGGYCAYAVAKNTTASAEPDLWDITDGKLYLNYSKSVQKTWRGDKQGFITKADNNWPNVIK